MTEVRWLDGWLVGLHTEALYWVCGSWLSSGCSVGEGAAAGERTDITAFAAAWRP